MQPLIPLLVTHMLTTFSGGNTFKKHHSPDHFLACLSEDSQRPHGSHNLDPTTHGSHMVGAAK